MPRTIHIAAHLPFPPDKVFDMYLNLKTHSEITGGPVTIGSKAGAKFRAFEGMLTGTILQVIPKRLIVQSWRGSKWKKSDIDSTLILSFWPERRGTRVELIHVNVPKHDFADISNGWEIYYFKPWREYVDKRKNK